jgi:hypothetical protein
MPIELGEAVRLANLIADGTGRGWTDEGRKVLTEEICRWKDPGAAYAAADEIAHSYADDWRPSIGKIRQRYLEAESRAAAREAMHAAAERAACDGTGFTAGVPCKRCKPHLRELYREDEPEGGEMWVRWRNGVSLDILSPGIRDRVLPQPCKPDDRHDPSARPVSVAAGAASVSAGYEAATGRTPGTEPYTDPDKVEAAIRAVGRQHNGRWLAHVTDVNLAFGNDFGSVRRSLLAIDPQRLDWANNGALALQVLPDSPVVPPEPPKAYAPPPVPATASDEPGELAKAIAETMKRVTDF